MYGAERLSLESSLVSSRLGNILEPLTVGKTFSFFIHYKSQRTRINPAQSAPEDTPLGVRGVERTSGGLTLDGKALEYLTQLESIRFENEHKVTVAQPTKSATSSPPSRSPKIPHWG